MEFDITQNLEQAAARIAMLANGTDWADLHEVARSRYRDLVRDTETGVVMGRTDYEGLEAIAAEVIRELGSQDTPSVGPVCVIFPAKELAKIPKAKNTPAESSPGVSAPAPAKGQKLKQQK